MLAFEAALDDYLHQIVRTRPWTVTQEEAVLNEFAAWLLGQPDLGGDLVQITPDVIKRYRAATTLDEPQFATFEAAVGRLTAWAEYQGLIPHNRLKVSAAAV